MAGMLKNGTKIATTVGEKTYIFFLEPSFFEKAVQVL